MALQRFRGRLPLVAFILLAVVCLLLLGFACACLTHHPMQAIQAALSAIPALPAQIEVWPLKLQDALPTVPVPLRSPDPDVPLELGAALAAIYDEAAYDLSIHYNQPPPPPPLTAGDAAWMGQLLESRSPADNG